MGECVYKVKKEKSPPKSEEIRGVEIFQPKKKKKKKLTNFPYTFYNNSY